MDRISDGTGRLVAWLTLAMVINTVVVIVARDAFGFGRIWMQELTTWLHAIVFLLGISYALRHDEHVRVDIFYRTLSPRGQAWVNLVGTLILMLPVCVVVIWQSWDYVFGSLGSWADREASSQAGGLPFPFPSIAKTVMILTPVLLALQGIANATRAWRTLRSPQRVESDA